MVLTKYQQAVQKLDTTGTHRLFAPNSQVFESGGVEGGDKAAKEEGEAERGFHPR